MRDLRYRTLFIFIKLHSLIDAQLRASYVGVFLAHSLNCRVLIEAKNVRQATLIDLDYTKALYMKALELRLVERQGSIDQINHS